MLIYRKHEGSIMLNGVEIIVVSVLLSAGVVGWVVIESAIWFFNNLTILWG